MHGCLGLYKVLVPSSAPKLRTQTLWLQAPTSVHAQTYVRPRSTGKRERASEDTRHRYTPWCQGRLQTCVFRPCVSECLRPRGRLRVHGLRVQRPYLRCTGGREGRAPNTEERRTPEITGSEWTSWCQVRLQNYTLKPCGF